MNVIRFEEALKIIDSGIPVKLQYVSLDRRRKTGGKLKEHEVVLSKLKSEWIPKTEASKVSDKSQNHYENFTRNFYQCINGSPTMNVKTIHLPLILKINDKIVML